MSIENQQELPPIDQPVNLFEQVDQQVANGTPATVLVERSNGDITTAQVEGITTGRTEAFFGNISNGPTDEMLFKSVPNERLTDHYQEILATKLAGLALAGSELQTVEDPVLAKYTEDYVREHPFDHLLDSSLTEEQSDLLLERIGKMDLRTDDQKRADAVEAANEAFNNQRIAADHKYNQARQSGANHEVADASAHNAARKSYDELLAGELNKAGLK